MTEPFGRFVNECFRKYSFMMLENIGLTVDGHLAMEERQQYTDTENPSGEADGNAADLRRVPTDENALVQPTAAQKEKGHKPLKALSVNRNEWTAANETLDTHLEKATNGWDSSGINEIEGNLNKAWDISGEYQKQRQKMY